MTTRRAMTGLIPLLLVLMSAAAGVAEKPCDEFLGLSNSTTYSACAGELSASIASLRAGAPLIRS